MEFEREVAEVGESDDDDATGGASGAGEGVGVSDGECDDLESSLRFFAA